MTLTPSDWSKIDQIFAVLTRQKSFFRVPHQGKAALILGLAEERASHQEKRNAEQRSGRSVIFKRAPGVFRACVPNGTRGGTGDGRMDPRARVRLPGAVHRRGRVRGRRGLARVAVPARGECASRAIPEQTR